MTRRFQGLNAWILQRASAIYLAVYFVFLVVTFAFFPPANYQEWRMWVTHPVNTILLVMFFALLLGHIWVGLRDVFMDYISSLTMRAVLLFSLAIGIFAIGIWFARIIVVAIIK